MKFNFLFALTLCAAIIAKAQLPIAYLSKKQSLALGNLSKTAQLVVVIENEKNPGETALIAAVKQYWKLGTIKYMSGLEFSEKFKENTLDPSKLYLFNNFARNYIINAKKQTIANHYGYYLTNEPRKLINSPNNRLAPPYLYFSGASLYDNKQQPISGFYSLMIKNFNHDIAYCQLKDNFLKRQRNKRKNGVRFFKEEDLNDKTLLLVKEQTKREEKSKKKKRREQNNSPKKKQKFITDDYTKKKVPTVVFPEDIDHALKINDDKVMLYSGGSIYSAKDGSVYCTSRRKDNNVGLITYRVISLGAAVAIIIIIL